jgi:hypothetical protein
MPNEPSNVENAPSHNAIVWVSDETLEALTGNAKESGIPLNEHIINSIHHRLVAQLAAPSPIWLATPTAAAPLMIELTADVRSVLDELCEATGQRPDVVLSNLVVGGPPTPPPELPLGYLRVEPGKGRVFGMYFEIAGFQYALLRKLAGETLSVGQVLDIAFIALAGHAASAGSLNGHPISQAARQFATKVIMIENRRRP